MFRVFAIMSTNNVFVARHGCVSIPLIILSYQSMQNSELRRSSDFASR